MAIDVGSQQTFSDEELLKLIRQAIAEVTFYGQSNIVRGRTYTRADLAELRKLEGDLTARVNSASTGRVVNYARRVRS